MVNTPAIRFGPADATERAWIEAALAAERQPQLGAADVDFLAARDLTGTILGAVGLERYGADGLLRSLVVAPAARGRGIGRALVAALEAQAAAAGIETLYLLTETADGFFAALGYEGIERTAAPTALAGSEEFRGSCPAHCRCFRKRLAVAVV